jgi:FMN phosphatase YigB (HAD superfamily)
MSGCWTALGLSGSQVLFIDDARGNVEGATQVGLHAVHYDSLEVLKEEVQSRFGLSLPEYQEERLSAGIRLITEAGDT